MFNKKKPPQEERPPAPSSEKDKDQAERLITFSLSRRNGRTYLGWNIDADKIKESAKETLQGKGAELIGNFFDRVFKKKDE